MISACKTPETIFGEAIAIDSQEARAAFLDRACQDDSQLRRELETLVADHFRAGDFLETPAAIIDLPSSAEHPGTVIGRYKLLEEIAEGGMGVVYLAEQQEPFRRKVALKIIKPGLDTREVIARFEAERQALALMDHPNIAKVFDAGETESGRPYFVMELVDGCRLTEYCDFNELTIRERLELFVQVCQTVQHAHQKGIVHRDIKPSNVMVAFYDDAPVPKIIDFGVAKAIGGQLAEQTALTYCGQMIGTPLYMSPEQAEMRDGDVDIRSDVYSLGVMLYELLTGSTPFDQERLRGAHFDEIRRMIREDEPPQPSARIDTLGPLATTVSAHRKTNPAGLSRILRGGLEWIVMKALEKDRSRRYATAAEFGQDVQRYMANEPVAARRPALRVRLAKWARRHRTIASTVAVIVVSSLATAGMIAAAMLTVRWRDATGKETTVETSQPSSVTIAKDGTVSIVPMKERDKKETRGSEKTAADAVALKDFFNGVRGHWVPVAQPQKLFMDWIVRDKRNGMPAGGVTFHGNVVEVLDRTIKLPAFKSTVQAIRAKVKVIDGSASLDLRWGPEGTRRANFAPRGGVTMGAFYNDGENAGIWRDGPVFEASRVEAIEYLPIGVAAINDKFVIEYCGQRYSLVDPRITFGSPGFGVSNADGHAYFKDIEVFVPETDSAPVALQPEGGPVALKDFFKEVRGKWVPVLRNEKDLARGRTMYINGPSVFARSGVVDVRDQEVILTSMTGGVQGIRAKVKWDLDVASLVVRFNGPQGDVFAQFYQTGRIESGGDFRQNGVFASITIPMMPSPPAAPSDRYVPIGLGAIGSKIRCELNGFSKEWRDKRLAFGSPGIRARHAFFKDVEVFMPDNKEADTEASRTQRPSAIDTFTNEIGATFVRVQGGQFSMGCSDGLNILPSEKPHTVQISKPFYIGTCEITQEQYQSVMRENPSSYAAKGKNAKLVRGTDTRRYPVECVSWDDAQSFCERLSAREHRHYRLPTEAEWEYCCRAGTVTSTIFGDTYTPVDFNTGKHFGGPMRVGVFPENKWGLCDMHGNVAEWCQDFYSDTYYDQSPAVDPPGPATGVDHVVRGGSWATMPNACCSDNRSSAPPDTRRDDLGFRIVLEITQPEGPANTPDGPMPEKQGRPEPKTATEEKPVQR